MNYDTRSIGYGQAFGPRVVRNGSAGQLVFDRERRGAVGDDEEPFAWTDEPEIPASQLLYRGGIVAKALRFAVKALVRLPQLGDGTGQLPVLAPNPEGGRQSPFADQRVRDQDRGQEAEQQPREMPSPPRALLPAAHRGDLGPLRAGKGERRLLGARPPPGASGRDAAPPGRGSRYLGHSLHVSVEARAKSRSLRRTREE